MILILSYIVSTNKYLGYELNEIIEPDKLVVGALYNDREILECKISYHFEDEMVVYELGLSPNKLEVQ